jgi:hypothetical protein
MGLVALWLEIAFECLNFLTTAATHIHSQIAFKEGSAQFLALGLCACVGLHVQAGHRAGKWAWVALTVGGLIPAISLVDASTSPLHWLALGLAPFQLIGLLHPLSKAWFQGVQTLDKYAKPEVQLLRAKSLQKIALVWMAVPYIALKVVDKLGADASLTGIAALPVAVMGAGLLAVGVLRANKLTTQKPN